MALSYKNDNDIDEQNNPANRLSATENEAAFDDIADNYDKTADPSQENDNIAKARDREENFSSNVSNKNAGNKAKFNLKNFFSKNSKNGALPSSVVIISLLVGIFGIGGMGINSLMVVHLKENLTEKFDTQNTSMTIRTERLWAKKMAGENTRGDCKITKVLCRYSKPSSHMLKQLKKAGVLALDKDGRVIKHSKVWPDKRPAKYIFQDGMNGLKTLNATEFADELKKNPKFAAKFRMAYNPRWVGFADSVFKKVAGKFFISKDQGKLGAKDQKAAKEKLAKGNGGREGAAGKDGGTGKFDDLATKNLGTLAKYIEASGKGGLASMLVGAGCVLSDIPSLVANISRELQMTQVIQYAFPFLSLADSIKYGDGNTKDIGIVGDMLTANLDGKTAMDSFGMQYALHGATASDNKDYKKMTPGGGELALGAAKMDTVMGGDERKQVCSAATSPAGAAAIAGAWGAVSAGSLGAGLVAAGVNYAAGEIIGAALKLLAGPFISAFVDLIPDSAKEAAMKFLVGDMTENLSGPAVGDAIVSGSSNMMAQTANTGGNMPLSADQAVKYQAATDQVQLAYAEEVRATHSPFDISSKYTFMGSIFDSMLPYFGKIHNVTDVMSTIGSITASSFGSLFNVGAADAKSQYQMCDIPSIKDSGVAAGPFCNINYGIPTDTLGRDPDDVAQYMIDNDYIDDEGKIDEDGEYKQWIDQCANGDPQYAMSCQISGDNKEMYSNFALYTVDSRVQVTMDDPADTAPMTGSSGGGGSSETPSGDLPTGSTKELAQKLLDSKNIQFQTGAGKTAMKKIASTGKATTCGSPTISPLMLGMLLSASEKFKLTLGVVTDGRNCGSPNHDTGQGIDINGVRKPSDSFQQRFHWSGKKDGENARDFMKYMDSIGKPGRVNFGQINCWGPTGVSKPSLKNGIMFTDTCNHIHMDIRNR